MVTGLWDAPMKEEFYEKWQGGDIETLQQPVAPLKKDFKLFKHSKKQFL